MIRIATMNVRAAQQNDGWKHRWSKRCRAHAGLVELHQIHLAAMQELRPYEAETLAHELSKASDWVVQADLQGNGIAYLQSRLSPLSEMVTVVYDHQSKIQAAYSKMMMLDINQEKPFWFYNTHLQSGASTIRVEQMKQLISDIDETVKNEPVVVAGDFNSISTVPKLFEAESFTSMWQSALKTNDSMNTFQGWLEDEEEPSHGYEMVDTMYLKNNVTCVEAAVSSSIWRGTQASDHNMVWADMIMDDRPVTD